SISGLNPPGGYPINELAAPAGKAVVQLKCTTPTRAGAEWEWADNPGEFSLVDEPGTVYKASGAMAMVMEGSRKSLVAQCECGGSVASIGRAAGHPQDGYIIFVLPKGIHFKQFNYEGKQVAPLNEVVPQ